MEKMLEIYDDVVGMIPRYYTSPDARLEGDLGTWYHHGAEVKYE